MLVYVSEEYRGNSYRVVSSNRILIYLLQSVYSVVVPDLCHS